MQTLRSEDYFDAGLHLLAVGGEGAVTVDNLCAHLQVTKGSFYHHFPNRRSFVRELMGYWEARYSRRLAELALAVDDPLERLRLLQRLAIELNHEAESAIRSLARTDPFVQEVQVRLDANRAEMLERTMVQAGLDRGDARCLADTALAVLVGMQQLRPLDRRRLRAAFDEVHRMVDARLDLALPSRPETRRRSPVAP